MADPLVSEWHCRDLGTSMKYVSLAKILKFWNK